MRFLGHAVVIERHGRWVIEVAETGQVLYAPLAHVRLAPDAHADLQGLADHFTARQNRDPIAIIWFEAQRRH